MRVIAFTLQIGEVGGTIENAPGSVVFAGSGVISIRIEKDGESTCIGFGAGQKFGDVFGNFIECVPL